MDKALSTRIERMRQKAAEIEANGVCSSPYGRKLSVAPRHLPTLRAFSAIQGKDREYIGGKKLAAGRLYSDVHRPAAQPRGLTLWETLVHLARETRAR